MTARLIFAGEEIAPGEMERRAARAAAGFDRAGIREGDVVALMFKNEPAFLEAMLACRLLGAYHCPVNWHFKAHEAGHILRDSGARALAIDPDLRAQIASGIPEGMAVIDSWPRWRDTHAPWTGPARTPRGNMPYTSGTTGRPKGVRREPATEAERAVALETFRVIMGLEPGMRAFKIGRAHV